ncbi:MAG: hypothetical protein CVT59_10525 [Actinobacteria bacterium HGW-Actinobacteria-1]|jgi:hypothetical protein|nr:MAG: hypothetical protein CVT59_10525 [Actinobacteria bacterium HGW-Actinobacteria-1]
MVRALDPDDAGRCVAKVRAELARADAGLPAAAAGMWAGDLFPAVALVKGEPGAAEQAGDAVLSGADGAAVAKALAALGIEGAGIWRTLSRPGSGVLPAGAAARVGLQLAAIDPAIVIALDATAALDTATALAVAVPPFGVPVAARGMILLAVDGFEASLGDEGRKREIWRQLRGLDRAPEYPKSERDARRRPVGPALF